MLLTDGNPNTLEDLRVYESAILDVAATEQIDLTTKMCLAVEEISQELVDALLDRPLSDPKSGVRRTIGVPDVVVSRQAKRWHAARTLQAFYRDAYFNQLNDRYQEKAKEYADIALEAKQHTMNVGIGIVMTPLPKAAPPAISSSPGSPAGDTYYVSVSWVNGALPPTSQEGQPSDPTTAQPGAGNVPVVSAGADPNGATGFNVYAGTSVGSMSLQTASPAALGSSVTLTSLVAGAPVSNGQAPDVYVTGGQVSKRG